MKSFNYLFCLIIFLTGTINYAFAAICATLPDVCVPENEIQAGCHCILTRDVRLLTARRFNRDVDQNDIRFMILPQSAVDQLNRFFAVHEVNAQLTQNVFSKVSTQVSVQVMTMQKSFIRQVVDLNSDQLSENTRNLLANCNEGLCEQPGNLHQLSDNPAKREFLQEKAIRFDFDNDTLIAFASSKSEFQLENVREEYQEKSCKKSWLFFKKCKTETKYRDNIREFTDALRQEWKSFVNGQMVANFRLNNANLLV